MNVNHKKRKLGEFIIVYLYTFFNPIDLLGIDSLGNHLKIKRVRSFHFRPVYLIFNSFPVDNEEKEDGLLFA